VDQQFGCALKHDGTVWCWGNNAWGRLGDGTTNNSLVPTQVQGGLTGVVDISTGWAVACALKSDGTVWCWGHHGWTATYSQVGDETHLDRSLPVQVITGVAELSRSLGDDHSCARKTDGTVWCWGKNSSGQLGTGNNTDSMSPVQVLNFP
jgi:alpha-tubulin suppressor-like RCC1 family protein